MEDPSEKYLAEKLNQPNAPTIVKDGKVKFHGTVLRTILQRGPPRYFAAYLPTGVIYGVAYHYEELLPICQKIARVKKCEPACCRTTYKESRRSPRSCRCRACLLSCRRNSAAFLLSWHLYPRRRWRQCWRSYEQDIHCNNRYDAYYHQ